LLLVDFVGQNIKVKIIPGPLFNEERDKIKTIPGKKPIYGLENGIDKFLYWEIPQSSLGSFCEKFNKEDLILQSKKVEALFSGLNLLLKTVEELPKIQEEVKWIRPPRFPCQEDYIRISREKNKLLCALSPGLGKSYISLSRANILGFSKLLIVGLKSTLTNTWKSEIYKTLNKDCLIYHGTIKQREKLRTQFPQYDIVVTTYSMVGELQKSGQIFDQIIIDEAHLLAHSDTKIYKNVEGLFRNNPNAGIQLLSGTPVLHKPSDLWGLVHLLYPQLAGDFYSWKFRYEEVLKSINVRGKSGRLIKIPIKTKIRNLDDLHKRIKPFTVRVKRDELVSFEESVEIEYVDLVGKQKSLYNQLKTDLIIQLENKEISVQNSLAQLTRLLQVAEGAFNLEESWLDSGKLDYLEEILKSSNEKIVVWSRFKPIIKILGERFKKRSVLFNGDISLNQKTLGVWAFQGVDSIADEKEYYRLAKLGNWKLEPGEAQYFFGTIDRGTSAGLNLHASYRQYFTSFHWNGNINEQAASRLKRIDQDADVVYTTFIVSQQTIEDYALKLIFNNLKNCLHIIDGGNDISLHQITDIIRSLK